MLVSGASMTVLGHVRWDRPCHPAACTDAHTAITMSPSGLTRGSAALRWMPDQVRHDGMEIRLQLAAAVIPHLMRDPANYIGACFGAGRRIMWTVALVRFNSANFLNHINNAPQTNLNQTSIVSDPIAVMRTFPPFAGWSLMSAIGFSHGKAV